MIFNDLDKHSTLFSQVVYTSAPGQGGILAQREFDRRFSPHYVSDLHYFLGDHKTNLSGVSRRSISGVAHLFHKEPEWLQVSKNLIYAVVLEIL